MSDSFLCPYCGVAMPIYEGTRDTQFPSFGSSNGRMNVQNFAESTIQLVFFRCPQCGNYTVFATGIGKLVKDVNMIIKPNSLAKQFPEYIPEAILNDYKEACAIVNLSPKASATLSRRCLQGMIRDFFDIKESNLARAIEKLEGKIPAPQWRVIDGIRRIGNIGAHMEKDINLIVDIEPGEAQKLIKLIEHLLEQWYINRHDQEQLYADIIDIDESKQAERKKPE